MTFPVLAPWLGSSSLPTSAAMRGKPTVAVTFDEVYVQQIGADQDTFFAAGEAEIFQKFS
jgi:hypothetical protein